MTQVIFSLQLTTGTTGTVATAFVGGRGRTFSLCGFKSGLKK